jgi:hypothetical protein
MVHVSNNFMIRVVITALITILFGNNKAYTQTTDSTLNQLLNIDSASFVNKPLDSIIAVLPAGYIEMRVVGFRNTARNLRIMYANRVWIDLHVRQFNYMNPVDIYRIWNISLMRKKSLNKVAIYKGVNCYKGCSNY